MGNTFDGVVLSEEYLNIRRAEVLSPPSSLGICIANAQRSVGHAKTLPTVPVIGRVACNSTGCLRTLRYPRCEHFRASQKSPKP